MDSGAALPAHPRCWADDGADEEVRDATLTILVFATSAAGTADPVETFGRPLGLTLLDSRLEQLESLLDQHGQADDKPFVCYVASTHDVFLRLLLDGRGGSERHISGFTMRELSGATAAPCVQLQDAAVGRANLAVGGLRLGMSRAAVKELLGPGYEAR